MSEDKKKLSKKERSERARAEAEKHPTVKLLRELAAKIEEEIAAQRAVRGDVRI